MSDSRPLVKWLSTASEPIPDFATAQFVDGGLQLDRIAIEGLRSTVNLEIFQPLATGRRGRTLGVERIRKLRRVRGAADAWILDFLAASVVRLDQLDGVKVGLIYHIDHRFSSHRTMYALLEARFKRRIGELDGIVTISEHWANKLRSWGARKVAIVHNFIATPTGFTIPVRDGGLRSRFGLPDRPVVCLGRSAYEKGTDLAFDALKDGGYNLITTGRNDLGLPCPNFDLPYPDYLSLLAACDATVVFSRMEEGWCRQIHESMLVGTPATGSGAGGMTELLRGGGLPICNKPGDLPKIVAGLIDGKVDHAHFEAYAASFTESRFMTEWKTALESMGVL